MRNQYSKTEDEAEVNPAGQPHRGPQVRDTVNPSNEPIAKLAGNLFATCLDQGSGAA